MLPLQHAAQLHRKCLPAGERHRHFRHKNAPRRAQAGDRRHRLSSARLHGRDRRHESSPGARLSRGSTPGVPPAARSRRARRPGARPCGPRAQHLCAPSARSVPWWPCGLHRAPGAGWPRLRHPAFAVPWRTSPASSASRCSSGRAPAAGGRLHPVGRRAWRHRQDNRYRLRRIGQRATPCFDGIGEEPVNSEGSQRMAVVDAGAVLGFSGEFGVAGDVVEMDV